MNLRTVLAGLVLAAAALAPGVTPDALAETRDATTVTLGWQTEHADLVVVATPEDASFAAPPAADDRDGPAAREVGVRVDQALKGDVALGATLRVVVHEHGLGSAWRPGTQHLLFLRAVRAPDGTLLHHALVSGAFSVKPVVADTVEARFPALVAALRDVLDQGSPDALRAVLVTWMEDADPGVAWSAATDFVRHAELHAQIPPAEAARVVAAYRRQPIGKNTKEALAYAAAATRDPAAVVALVDSLLVPEATRIRESVAEALRRTGSPEAERLLVARLAATDAPATAPAAPSGAAAPPAAPATPPAPVATQRRALLGALAVVGGTGSTATVRPLLADADPGVRLDAAAALGGMARNARAKDPDARLGVASDLAARLAGDVAATLPENELRAVLWALAQLDEPGAFDAVRRAAESADRPEVREWAKRLLDRPRQSLLLRE